MPSSNEEELKLTAVGCKFLLNTEGTVSEAKKRSKVIQLNRLNEDLDVVAIILYVLDDERVRKPLVE